MKKAIEEFTGTIGVGFMSFLGLLLIIDSKWSFWQHVEFLTGTDSWGVFAAIPLLVINYIVGLITIEFAELIGSSLNWKAYINFRDHLQRVVEIDSDLLSARYSEVLQNRRILLGSSIGFLVLGIGVCAEGRTIKEGVEVMGYIGLAGGIILATLCPFIASRIQSRFNRRMF